MRAHVQNPYTRSPSLMVNLSIEKATQLLSALQLSKEHAIKGGGPQWSANQEDALNCLRRTLEHAFSTPRPNGVKGCVP